MKTTATTKGSRARDGKYQYSTNWARLCVCGQTLGQHTAERPHECDETDCDGFRAAKKVQP